MNNKTTNSNVLWTIRAYMVELAHACDYCIDYGYTPDFLQDDEFGNSFYDVLSEIKDCFFSITNSYYRTENASMKIQDALNLCYSCICALDKCVGRHNEYCVTMSMREAVDDLRQKTAALRDLREGNTSGIPF